MSRSTIGDRRAIIFDKQLELRDYDAAAISASTTETAINFEATKQMAFKCVVDVAAHTGYVATTAEWTIDVEACATSDGTYQSAGSLTLDGTANRFDVPLSGEWIEDIESGAAYVRVRATKTGSPGNLTYGAFLAKC